MKPRRCPLSIQIPLNLQFLWTNTFWRDRISHLVLIWFCLLLFFFSLNRKSDSIEIIESVLCKEEVCYSRPIIIVSSPRIHHPFVLLITFTFSISWPAIKNQQKNISNFINKFHVILFVSQITMFTFITIYNNMVWKVYKL